MKLLNQPRKVLAILLAIFVPGLMLAPCYAQILPTTSTPGITRGPLQTKFSGTDSGSLTATDDKGKRLGNCPLKHTDVSAKISGYLANVSVKQRFENPFKQPIEAVYTFPLSDTGTVDEMVMTIGNRTIHGMIKKREEARAMYEAAKNRGQTASLLDQERPNIFTQSLANIKPGEAIEITLHYVDVLPYEAGSFTFAFPTVVGPRYMPGAPVGKEGTGWSPDTTAVPDASRITPPVVPEGTRAGHDLSLKVTINAGLPLSHITSKLHEVSITQRSPSEAEISLKNKATIPNRDFIVSWQVASDKVQSGYLTHRDGKFGYFLVMLIPPKQVTPEKVQPKEMIFVVDRSGSQHGKPIEKAKETMNYVLDNMNPKDTFQVISFSSHPERLFDKPQVASHEMISRAKHYISHLQGDGGTEMRAAVEEACREPEPDHRLRIITMMTDGYIGNDFEILGLVRKLRGNSRWFPFGTGNSVNRFLIDNIAKEGGGEPDYVQLNDSAEAVAKKFYNRIASPVLTDINISFKGVEVRDVYPRSVSDVWAQRPLFITGRYEKSGTGTVVLRGFAQGKPYEQTLSLNLPEQEAANGVLGTIWARAQIDRLMSSDFIGLQTGQIKDELKDEIVRIALDHHVITQFTSFIAIDETPGSKTNGKPIEVTVPVNMPDGVSYKKIFGHTKATAGYFSGAFRASGQDAGSLSMQPMRMQLAAPGDNLYVAGKLAKQPNFAVMASPAPSVAPQQALPPTTAAAFSDNKGKEIAFSEPASAGIAKLDSNLQALISSKNHRELLSAGVPGDNPANLKEWQKTNLVDGDKVLVRVKVKDLSKRTLAQLKALGFALLSVKKEDVTVIGKIALTKLSNLAKLDSVVSIHSDGVKASNPAVN